MPILGVRPMTPRVTMPPGTRFGPTLVDVGPIRFGLVDSYGVEWYVEDLTGWDDTPDTVGVVTPKPDDMGVFLGQQTYGPRVMTLAGWIIAPDMTERDAARQRLTRAAPVNALTTVVVTDEPAPTVLARQCRARLSGQIKMARVTECAYQIQVTLLAPDPRKYAAEPTVVEIGLPTFSGGGVVPPFTLPFTLPERVSTGNAVATNQGDLDAPWTARIFGPITTPGLRNATTNQFFGVDIELGASDFLDIDSRDQTVVLNGAASRAALVTRGSSWWTLPPASTSEVRLTTSVLPSGATPLCRFTPYSAWS